MAYLQVRMLVLASLKDYFPITYLDLVLDLQRLHERYIEKKSV